MFTYYKKNIFIWIFQKTKNKNKNKNKNKRTNKQKERNERKIKKGTEIIRKENKMKNGKKGN